MRFEGNPTIAKHCPEAYLEPSQTSTMERFSGSEKLTTPSPWIERAIWLCGSWFKKILSTWRSLIHLDPSFSENSKNPITKKVISVAWNCGLGEPKHLKLYLDVSDRFSLKHNTESIVEIWVAQDATESCKIYVSSYFPKITFPSGFKQPSGLDQLTPPKS